MNVFNNTTQKSINKVNSSNLPNNNKQQANTPQATSLQYNQQKHREITINKSSIPPINQNT